MNDQGVEVLQPEQLLTGKEDTLVLLADEWLGFQVSQRDTGLLRQRIALVQGNPQRLPADQLRLQFWHRAEIAVKRNHDPHLLQGFELTVLGCVMQDHVDMRAGLRK
ncbi:MAG: hypothetical protein ACD_23C00932G0001 [uncultured bacterium]|nr:MAG: hypothetical protein ACD_23C00932G0001 [uncultured bacterium]